MTGPSGAQALNLVPALNAGHPLFNFLLDGDGDLIGVYDFLGSSLRGGPLTTTIGLLAGAAEAIGNRFGEELGGQLYSSVLTNATVDELDDVGEDSAVRERNPLSSRRAVGYGVAARCPVDPFRISRTTMLPPTKFGGRQPIPAERRLADYVLSDPRAQISTRSAPARCFGVRFPFLGA